MSPYNTVYQKAVDQYRDKLRPFPGWCGQHAVHVIVDGQRSLARYASRENQNRQSLVFLDDKPHVSSVEMAADGTLFRVFFDVRTTHGREYRARPNAKSDVFAASCEPEPL
eukprot:805653-Rhodomonas_salina.1